MMAKLIVFLLGIANFAAHRAVLESGHPMVAQMQAASPLFRPKVTLSVEFAVLLVALAMAAGGLVWGAWLYAGYTLGNAATAWALVTRRI